MVEMIAAVKLRMTMTSPPCRPPRGGKAEHRAEHETAGPGGEGGGE